MLLSVIFCLFRLFTSSSVLVGGENWTSSYGTGAASSLVVGTS